MAHRQNLRPAMGGGLSPSTRRSTCRDRPPCGAIVQRGAQALLIPPAILTRALSQRACESRRNEVTAMWQDRYMTRFYDRASGWVDGTKEFHDLCIHHIPSRSKILEIGAGPSNQTSRFLKTLGKLRGEPRTQVRRGLSLPDAEPLSLRSHRVVSHEALVPQVGRQPRARPTRRSARSVSDGLCHEHAQRCPAHRGRARLRGRAAVDGRERAVVRQVLSARVSLLMAYERRQSLRICGRTSSACVASDSP